MAGRSGALAETPPDSRTRGGWMGVSGRQRIAGKPGIRDETAGSRWAHHVAAPQRVDSQDRVGDQGLEL